MKIEKKPLEKSQVELNVELSLAEFKPYIEQGAAKVSESVKVEGFRPGKVPYEVLKQKVGEMTILEEAARLAINKTIDSAFEQELKDESPVGQPKVDIIKLAPENPLEYKITVAIIPSVTLGVYKDLKIKEEKAKIDEKEVNKMLDNLKEMKVVEKIVEREVKDGDKVTADISMFLDKVPLDGGQSKGTAVIMGKEYFVPGFDKKLIGTKKGETREFELSYPKEHHQKNLAGKRVEFKVTIQDVYERELPTLDDEFAKTVGLKNFEELKNNIEDNMKKEAEQKENQKAEIKMLDAVLSKSKFGDLPEVLIQNETDNMVLELERTITSQGGKFDEYLSSINKSKDQLALDLMPDSIKRVKSALMIREIAKVEKIEVAEKEIDEKIKELETNYANDKKVQEMIKESSYRHYLGNLLANQKVVKTLRDWNILK